MSTEALYEIPSSTSTLWRALTTFSKGKNLSPIQKKYVMENIKPDLKKLQAFKQMFGYKSTFVPSTYWHTRFFGVRILLASDKTFPFPLPGMVHLTDTIKQYENILPTDNLRMECSLGDYLVHEKGTAFETTTKLYRGNELVWEENTVNLHIGKTKFANKEYNTYEFPELIQPKAEQLLIPANTGRKYAKISGDFNPIHIHPLGAKLFGFKKSLMHGWYGLNKILSQNQDMMTKPHELFVAFKKPLFLPGDVILKQSQTGEGIQFEIADRKEGYPNLKGKLNNS
jgi:hypothetical protein